MEENLLSRLEEHSFAYLVFYVDKDNNIIVKASMDNEIYIRALASKALDVGSSLMEVVDSNVEE